MGQFYDKYLKNIKLNSEKVDWGREELGYLKKVFERCSLVIWKG